jgi:hypothetical protein
MKSIQAVAKEAIQIQDACNLSGVVHSFSRAMETIWAEAREGEGKGTEWVNTHPIVTLYIDKLLDLNRRSDAFEAWSKVEAIANQPEPETTEV